MAKIFLDDYRNPEANMKNFNVVRSYRACNQLLQLFANNVEIADLDFDLGAKETGLDVLGFMAEQGIMPVQINIHSDHPAGAAEIRQFAKPYFPETKVTAVRVSHI